MSYDLFFLKPVDQPRPTVSQLQEFFMSRDNYGGEDTQFWYQNEDTGVYFSFDLDDSPDRDDEPEERGPREKPDDGLDDSGFSFNLNYFRPHFFGLEAAPELSALIEHFGFKIDDPQNEGMGRGEFTADGFIKGWNAGNRFGYSACMNNPEGGEAAVITMPTEEIERLWTWNYQRKRLQESIEADAYVALIRIIAINGQAKSIVVWGDGISEALPQVDYIVMVRDKLAPRKFFQKKRDSCLVPFSALDPILPIARKISEPSPHFLFAHDQPPKEVVSLFRSQRPFENQLEGVSWDQVLNDELVRETRRA